MVSDENSHSHSRRIWRSCSGVRRPTVRTIAPVALGAILLVTYQGVASLGIMQGDLPSIRAFWSSLVTLCLETSFWDSLAATVYAWCVGVAIAVCIGVPLGLFLGSSTFAFRSSRVVVEFLRPIPPVAILPLAILTLGSGHRMELWLVAFATVWPILMNAMYGVKDIDRVARDTLKSYRVGRVLRIRYLIVPTATPSIATGIRVSVSIGLIVAISAELIAGGSGLGVLIDKSQYAGDYARMFAIIGASGVLGLAATGLFRIGERKVLWWSQAHR